jgi:hypothetical protein
MLRISVKLKAECPSSFFPPQFGVTTDMPKMILEEVIHRELTSVAVKAGIDPAIIYAINRTGMILVGGKEDHWSEADLAEWDAAIEEYSALSSKPLS